jgi:hypothetical protein
MYFCKQETAVLRWWCYDTGREDMKDTHLHNFALTHLGQPSPARPSALTQVQMVEATDPSLCERRHCCDPAVPKKK